MVTLTHISFSSGETDAQVGRLDDIEATIQDNAIFGLEIIVQLTLNNCLLNAVLCFSSIQIQ